MVGSLQIVDFVSLGLHGIEKALDERIYLAPRLDRLDPAFRDCVKAVVRAGDLPEDRAGMPFEMAKVTATAITLVWNFLSKKLTIFR